jgi:hypothetical protein
MTAVSWAWKHLKHACTPHPEEFGDPTAAIAMLAPGVGAMLAETHTTDKHAVVEAHVEEFADQIVERVVGRVKQAFVTHGDPPEFDGVDVKAVVGFVLHEADEAAKGLITKG